MEPTTALVDNLVTQFSSAFDCFRELVQNSIDAGSTVVDVWTSFEVGDDHVGTIQIVVEDFGEGMDEAIIDTQLTQLFASSKEDDLTKIGKFGIGFVSVFALNPRAVLVHTGRNGEYWEVLFHPDRTFTKTRIDQPVEGTTVTLFLEGAYADYRRTVRDVEASLRRWCSHASSEISFEDRTPPPGEPSERKTINAPFDELDAICVVSEAVKGTRVVCGYSIDPTYAFYNSGLALAMTHDAQEVLGRYERRFRHVSVKVDSRFLEHTLSRDTVMMDENWERAVSVVQSVANGPLPQRLISELEELAARKSWDMATMHAYAQRIGFLAREPIEVISNIVSRKVFRDVNGGVWSPEQVWEALQQDGRVLITDAPSELTRRLGTLGIPVILGKRVFKLESYTNAPGDWSDHPLGSVPLMVARCVSLRSRSTLWGTIKRFFGVDLAGEVESALADPQLVYLPVAVDPEPPADAIDILQHASQLLQAIDSNYEKLGTFVPSAAGREIPFFVTGREFSEVMARPPRGFENRSHAAVNREHPHFRRLVRIYATRPELAAYCLAKSLLLTEDRMLNRDLDLAAAAQGRS